MKKNRERSPQKGLKFISFTYIERIKIHKILKRFYIVNEEYVKTRHKSLMIAVGSGFVYELINFYNTDVSLNASICKSIRYNSKNDEKLIYYLELFYTKLVTCWEYLFSYMNEYLKTDLMPNEQVKKELIENQMYEHIPIQHDEYIEIKKILYPSDKQKQIREELRKKLIVLTPDKLKQKIRKTYEESELINGIFECYSDNLVIEAKHIRNLIVHSDSLQKNFSFGINDLFNDIAICSRDTDYFPKLISQIDDNMFMLKKAILLFKEMVINDKIPNHIENAGKKFKTYDYKCDVCECECIVPDMLKEYFEKYVTCGKCGNKKFSKISETLVSELFYGERVSNLLNMEEYWDEINDEYID